jgi:lysyl-tRNA synthetase class 2
MIDEYEQNRRNKLTNLRLAGTDGYDMPKGWHTWLTDLQHAKVNCGDMPDRTPDTGVVVVCAGRVVLLRVGGGLTFMTVSADGTEMQVAVAKNRADQHSLLTVKNLDLGDFIAVKGRLANSKTGEPTIWAMELRLVSKAILPPPAKFEGLEDKETRYRKRYADLSSDPEVMRVFQLRAKIIREIREYLWRLEYTEVETPMLQSMSGGAAAPTVRDAPSRVRHSPVSSDRAGTIPQAATGWWLHKDFRAEPELSQRGDEYAAQSRVHHAGGVLRPTPTTTR